MMPENVIVFGVAAAGIIAALSGQPWSYALLLLLAASATHLIAVRHWGAGLARRWALTVFIAVALALTVGVLTGQPFGPFHFTVNSGLRIGRLPLFIPLGWSVVMGNVLLVSRIWLPSLALRQEAALVATGVTFFDFVLEPFAVWGRGWWIWEGNRVPFQNYIAWWVIAYLLARLAAPTAAMRPGREWRPAAILGVLLVVIAGERLRYGI